MKCSTLSYKYQKSTSLKLICLEMNGFKNLLLKTVSHLCAIKANLNTVKQLIKTIMLQKEYLCQGTDHTSNSQTEFYCYQYSRLQHQMHQTLMAIADQELMASSSSCLFIVVIRFLEGYVNFYSLFYKVLQIMCLNTGKKCNY